ncbi:MAG: Xaa-Pro peptidase family protein [Nanoarchaeota archaeon]|nr:Xaa-Pro peptidase family protein [Nanoarchaeota archaeon]MBU1632156.1 Xaa-Pro peptidase family protein [Nanoarchaeota archaeon]MBU1876357.1 Xaa-Pro peptidase family protein [Nanoarchaeota archaeon]
MKLKIFQKYLNREEIDLAFLISPDSNITYFTQMKPSKAILTISPNDAYFYLSELDLKPKLKNIEIVNLNKDWEKEIADKKNMKIGINKENIPLSYYEKLKKAFPKAIFIDISLVLLKLRSQKIPEEINKISHACQITTNSFNDLVANFSLKKIRTEQDVAFFLEKNIREQGADLSFPTIVASGKNAAIPHHQTSSEKLRKGFLLLDFGARYQNYCSDMSRVLYLDTISEEEKQLYYKLSEIQTKTIRHIASGSHFFSLEENVRKNLGNLSSFFIHKLGHGLGIDIHEFPSFSRENKQKVIKNQVFTIEPGIYFPQKYGLRIEDTIIFNNKARILTRASKELLKVRLS